MILLDIQNFKELLFIIGSVAEDESLPESQSGNRFTKLKQYYHKD